jgi:hypothetical protein
VAGLGLGGARTAIERLYPHPPHQRLHMPAADLAPLQSQQASQHTRTGEGELQVQPIQMPHDREVGRRHRARQIINAAAADLQNFRLLGDRQIVSTVDHRFALSNPALVSAPSKKLCAALHAPCGIETAGARLPTGRERPIRFWWHVTPLKNLVHGLLRT